jgi:hypothetical protein
MSNESKGDKTVANRGTDKTPRGVLPATQLKRHGLKENTVVSHAEMEHKVLNSWGHRKQLKNLIEMWATYRLTSHKVLAPHLAKPLVMGARYFCDVARQEFRNRDKAPAPTEAEAAAQA